MLQKLFCTDRNTGVPLDFGWVFGAPWTQKVEKPPTGLAAEKI